MLFAEFRALALNYLNNYYKNVSQGDLKKEPSHTILYPQIAYFAECKDGFALELGGIGKQKSLTSKIIKPESVVEFLDPTFNGERKGVPFVKAARNNVFSGFCIYPQRCSEALNEFFPSNNNYYKVRFTQIDESCPIFDISDNTSGLIIDNTLICNAIGEAFRYRHIMLLMIFARNTKTSEFLSRLKFVFEETLTPDGLGRPVYGVFACNVSDERIFAATQLRSLVMRRGVHETIIGSFINSHKEIIYQAFQTKNFVYEPSLDWIEHDGTVTDQSINPDLMFEREDGFYDIVDFKLPKIDTLSITKNKRNRRGFVSYVGNGIQQLANYREYFEYPSNSNYAFSKYSIKIKDPNLFLIVGSKENAHENEIRQAMRQYQGTKITIIDFDTLISKSLQ